MEQIDELLIKRKDREHFIRELLSSCLARGFETAVITESKGNRFDSLKVIQSQGSTLYRPATANDSGPISKMLIGIKPWHYSKFCILVCEKDVVVDLIRNPDLLKESIPNIQSRIKSKIFGYCFPVDDALIWYGDDAVHLIVTGVKAKFAIV